MKHIKLPADPGQPGRHMAAQLGVNGDGKPMSEEELKKLLAELKTGDEIKDNENHVQTKNEAEISNNKELIVLIEQMLKTTTIQPKQLVASLYIPDPVTGKKPIKRSNFALMGDQLVPTWIIIYLYSKNMLISCTLKECKYKSYKKFKLEDMKMSSKTLLDYGHLMAVQGSDGPKEGEPVFEKGKPKKTPEGEPVTFNTEWIEEWSRLTITAELRCIVDAKCYQVTAYSLSGGNHA